MIDEKAIRIELISNAYCFMANALLEINVNVFLNLANFSLFMYKVSVKSQ